MVVIRSLPKLLLVSSTDAGRRPSGRDLRTDWWKLGTAVSVAVVVAPVRETCAEALGAAFKYMHLALELLPDLLGRVLPACRSGLENPDDDVQAVATDALEPDATAIIALQDPTLRTIVMLLWIYDLIWMI
ncbi:btaf1 RNA polymerase II, B-TFIID transcription factor-associated, 170kDa [Stylosanthes scabra]|uniref:Btaf1 RNA polymerase II, B-TFIID transcription factor-associated, 170kDa n=1 Tax=Stylosanthes scabra TaxID=79078 RepID=A0ABU6SQL3_9FABA|nr:btaf1 RNA polymerase II, B-TFIID transcription factor-associated, 170kDa [Stylosanthes scabra]